MPTEFPVGTGRPENGDRSDAARMAGTIASGRANVDDTCLILALRDIGD
jgi:hypothetical protein